MSDSQRRECSTGGNRKYIALVHAIKFCSFYNRRRMTCIAADGSCGYQYQHIGQPNPARQGELRVTK